MKTYVPSALAAAPVLDSNVKPSAPTSNTALLRW